MTGEGARDDSSYCHCEAHGAEAISSLFTQGLLRRPSADGLPRNDTTNCQSLFKLKMRGNSILRSVHHLSEPDHITRD